MGPGAKRVAVLGCWIWLAGCGSGQVDGPEAGIADQPETPATESSVDCRGPGRYQAGKEGSYRPCCQGLREVFYTMPAEAQGGVKVCISPPLRIYACVQGRCGDGTCEIGESDSCGCVADCPSAAWGDVPTGEVEDGTTIVEPAQPADASPFLDASGRDVVRPEGPPTLATGVDRERMAADILPVVADFIRLEDESLLPLFGFTSRAEADVVELGRPYGVFTIHKGPWLEFMGYWRVPLLVHGVYRSLVEVGLGANGYTFRALGSKDFAPMLADRERVAALSAALDMGRAGLLWIAGAYGDRYLAYEVLSGADALDPSIRVQSLGWYPSVVPGIDGAAAPPELSLAEIDDQLPVE